jgi:hypothetical protein
VIFSPETLVESGAVSAPADAFAEPQALVERWAERHGVDAARRLAETEDLADAVAKEITSDNTVDTYAKSWRVWTRFCAATGLPKEESSRGALVAFVAWMLRDGPAERAGYAPTSASTHLAAAVVGLGERGVEVSGDHQASGSRCGPGCRSPGPGTPIASASSPCCRRPYPTGPSAVTPALDIIDGEMATSAVRRWPDVCEATGPVHGRQHRRSKPPLQSPQASSWPRPFAPTDTALR